MELSKVDENTPILFWFMNQALNWQRFEKNNNTDKEKRERER